MFIVNLDFLNTPPQLYILNKKTNKTLLGGILFIIYFLLMLTIVIFYVLDYYLNDKYSIRYSHYKYYQNQGELLYQNNVKYNNFNFSFEFYKIKSNQDIEYLDNNFVLMDLDYNVIERNKYINTNIRDIAYYITYNCSGNCSQDFNDNGLVYMMEINYNGYKIEHQNENIPLETHNLNFTFNKILFFPLIKLTYFELILK